MRSIEQRAYWIFANQKSRCYNKKHGHYEWYGGRGINVMYTHQEFIPWYISEYNKFRVKDKVSKLDVGRINNDKDYSLDNIEIQTRLVNLQERNNRRGNPCNTHKEIISICLSTNKVMMEFSSKVEAAKFYSCDPKTVYNHAAGKTKQPFKFGPHAGKGISFRWKK